MRRARSQSNKSLIRHKGAARGEATSRCLLMWGEWTAAPPPPPNGPQETREKLENTGKQRGVTTKQQESLKRPRWLSRRGQRRNSAGCWWVPTPRCLLIHHRKQQIRTPPAPAQSESPLICSHLYMSPAANHTDNNTCHITLTLHVYDLIFHYLKLWCFTFGAEKNPDIFWLERRNKSVCF